jgi:hypothetical protein
MGTFNNWIKQPTTVAGIATFYGTLMALLLKTMTLGQAVPLLTGAAMSVILPDNSTAKQQAESLAKDMMAPPAPKNGGNA